MQWTGDDNDFRDEFPYTTSRVYVATLCVLLATVTLGGFLIRFFLNGTLL